MRGAGVKVAYLFGSRAAGSERPDSDADVAVLLDGELGLLDRERLADPCGRRWITLSVNPEIELNPLPLELFSINCDRSCYRPMGAKRSLSFGR